MLFVIYELRPGGAERVLVNILNNLSNSVKPVLVVLEKKEYLAHELKDNIKVYFLNWEKKHEIFRIIKNLVSIIKSTHPDIIFGFGYNANHLVVIARYLALLKIPVCINERTVTHAALNDMSFTILRKLFLRIVYKKADYIIAVSNSTRDSLVNLFGLSNKRITVINNPVDIKRILSLSSSDVEHPWFKEKKFCLIIAVGRLNKLKRFSNLIKAFSIIKNELENTKVIIVGGGEEHKRLHELIKKLGLTDRVALLGYQKNPYKYMSRADILVHPSSFEGFPNVIVEAMTCGLPVIVSKKSSGVGDVVKHGKNGLFVDVDNVELLADSILKLLNDKSMQDRFIASGREAVKEFSLEKIIKGYEDFLISL